MGIKFRYYICGEYGDDNLRPHYHAILYGIGELDSLHIQNNWALGFTQTAEFSEATAAYTCGYVTKKLIKTKAIYGLTPEFTQPSLNPGIGALTIPQIAEHLFTKVGWNEIQKTQKIPAILHQGKNKKIILGRYLKSKLADEFGTSKDFDNAEKAEAQLENEAALQALHVLHEQNTGLKEVSTLKLLKETMAQKSIIIKARQKITQSKRINKL